MSGRYQKSKGPYHVVDVKDNGHHVRYDIYVKNNPFLVPQQPLKRHQAYAIARLLNGEKESLKWAIKFSDPYIEQGGITHA